MQTPKPLMNIFSAGLSVSVPETHHGTASISESDAAFADEQRPLANARGSEPCAGFPRSMNDDVSRRVPYEYLLGAASVSPCRKLTTEPRA